ncbi:MAG: AMP-binding protein, partial [Planctomycetes bacterium]|nr:AMP-binding protein [Planctomycetota bacterium]
MSIAPTHTSAKTAGEGTGDAFNIASYLPRMAASRPEQAAVVLAGSKDRHNARLSFAELERLTNRYANGLVGAGFERGMRTLLMVRPGFDFIALVFALFKIGAVPVMIDPGMGARRMLECIRSVDPVGFVGIPLAHLMRVLRPRAFRTVTRVVTVGRRWCWGGPTLESISRGANEDFDCIETRRDETAAVLFTSGATGPAKGVVYEHGMFDAQVQGTQAAYGMEPGEGDLPTFPL